MPFHSISFDSYFRVPASRNERALFELLYANETIREQSRWRTAGCAINQDTKGGALACLVYRDSDPGGHTSEGICSNSGGRFAKSTSLLSGSTAKVCEISVQYRHSARCEPFCSREASTPEIRMNFMPVLVHTAVSWASDEIPGPPTTRPTLGARDATPIAKSAMSLHSLKVLAQSFMANDYIRRLSNTEWKSRFYRNACQAFACVHANRHVATLLQLLAVNSNWWSKSQVVSGHRKLPAAAIAGITKRISSRGNAELEMGSRGADWGSRQAGFHRPGGLLG